MKSDLKGVSMVLLIIGGLNWGSEAFNYNVVDLILGSWPILVNVVYGLVGISALYMIYHMVNKH
ncbi:MAG: DUF378 domain-containing protein [Candidatus Pacearchaeota archaeon]